MLSFGNEMDGLVVKMRSSLSAGREKTKGLFCAWTPLQLFLTYFRK